MLKYLSVIILFSIFATHASAYITPINSGGGGAPSGPAGGDLSGTYPNPTVSEVQGVPIYGSGSNIGIGNASPASPLDVTSTNVATATGVHYLISGVLSVAPTADQLNLSENSAVFGSLLIPNTSTHNIYNVYGVNAKAQNDGSGTVSIEEGLTLNANSSAGTIQNLLGADIETSVTGGSVGDQYGIYVQQATSGTASHRYGLYLSGPSGSATHDYGIYQDGGQENYFSGFIGIGAQPAESPLDIFTNNVSFAVDTQQAIDINLHVSPVLDQTTNGTTVRQGILSSVLIPSSSANVIDTIMASNSSAENDSAADVNVLDGAFGQVTFTAGAITGKIAAGEFDSIVTGGTVANDYGVYSAHTNSGGTITNRYGVYLATPTGSATNDYGIYQAGTQANHFGGHVELASAAPTVSSCGGGTLVSGSSDNKGQVTGISAASACSLTFAASLPSAPSCVFSSSSSTAAPFVSSLSTSAVTAGMTALTGTLYYICF